MEHTRDYNTNFNPDWYMSTYYGSEHGHNWDSRNEILPFFVNSIHEFWQSGCIKAERLLDVGSGPCVHSVISGSEHVQEIHLSDYSAANRALLTDWWNGKIILHPPVTSYLMQKLNKKNSLEDFNAVLRAKVKSINHIDVTQSNPLGDNGTYDVITSSLCLESAVVTIPDYKQCVLNVKTLLKPKCWLILVAVLEETFVKIDSYKFEILSISQETLKEVFEECGFKILEFKTMTRPPGGEEYSDFKEACVMLARVV